MPRKPKHPPLRVAVVGLGHFAQVAVLPAIQRLRSVELAALVSGSPAKLDELGALYGVERRCDYDGLDDLLASGDVEAVYVVTPNDRHAPLVLQAARHGVHVLVEKPMAPTVAECSAMIQACAQNRVKLMVGYRLHFEAGNLHAIDLVQGGAIGAPRAFASTFTMQVREGNVRVAPDPGAGPLYDIGVYCINAARYLLREEPIEVTATAVGRPEDPRFEHVEETLAATLRFPSGALASFTVSFGAADQARYEVIGTQGRIEVESAYEYVQPVTVRHTQGDQTRTRRFPKRDQIAAEVEYFARCVREGSEPEPSGWEGLADVRVIAAIRQAASLGQHIALPPFERDQRPSEAQEIAKPPHPEPPTVAVESGSR